MEQKSKLAQFFWDTAYIAVMLNALHQFGGWGTTNSTIVATEKPTSSRGQKYIIKIA